MLCCLTMMTVQAQVPAIWLANGVEMPQFGIGTFNVPGNEKCKEAAVRQGKVRALGLPVG